MGYVSLVSSYVGVNSHCNVVVPFSLRSHRGRPHKNCEAEKPLKKNWFQSYELVVQNKKDETETQVNELQQSRIDCESGMNQVGTYGPTLGHMRENISRISSRTRSGRDRKVSCL